MKRTSWKNSLLERGKKDPNWWIKTVLGEELWSKQREIAQAVADNKRVAVPASFGVGKCYDKQTLILTESRGFQYFKDLLRTDKVATLVEGKMEFVIPDEYYEGFFEGDMIGVDNKQLNFLVTPNHRCYVRSDSKKVWEIKDACDIYGTNNHSFSRDVFWEGVDTKPEYTLDHYRFFGFWCADGSVDHNSRAIRIGQKNKLGYVKDLIGKIYSDKKVGEYEYDYTEGRKILCIFGSDITHQFSEDFGRLKSDGVLPSWLKNTTKDKLKAFLEGFFQADGWDWDVPGKTPVVSLYHEKLAKDLYEIAIKAGYIANLRYFDRGIRESAGYNQGMEVKGWSLSLSPTMGRLPRVKKNHWRKVPYKDKIYCVKVPSGIILTMRNGLAHWSGNTFLAARLALWWLYTHKPAKVITTAPCFDEQTEILTDSGWKLFKNLDGTEKVASRVEGKLEFVYPSEYFDYLVEGELVGYKSRDIDFLITPHHKCLVCPPGKDDFELHKAEDFYGENGWIFNKEIFCEGPETEFSLKEDSSKYPVSEDKHWYKKEYQGHVYCVTVPSGVVLVKRGGLYHWSGNTGRQVKDLLWSELRGAHAGSKFPLGGSPLNLSLTLAPDQFAVGFSTDDANMDMFTGYHSPNMMVIFDQAGGINPSVWKAAEGLMTSENCRWFVISNTAISDCIFADICLPDREHSHGDWKIVPIAAIDSPNIVAGKNIYPGIISVEWLEEKKRQWDVEDPLYKIFVLAQFVSDSQMTLIPYHFVQDALKKEGVVDADAVDIGLDVARSGIDNTVWFARSGSKALQIKRATGNDTMKTVSETIDFKNSIEAKYGIPVRFIKVDTIGVGSGVYDRLLELGEPVVAVNNAEGAIDSERYSNCRAEMAWSLRSRFEKGGVGLQFLSVESSDLLELLRVDITHTKYRITQNGRIILWSKDEIKKDLGRSPDYWDAMVMAFEDPKGGVPTIEFVPGSGSNVLTVSYITKNYWDELFGKSVPYEANMVEIEINTERSTF